MFNIFLIFLGSGLGGMCRYLVSHEVYRFISRPFPYGTLLVNATGCLLMGFLFFLVMGRPSETPLRSFLLVGFLGGYTTFSSFSIETIGLLEQGDWLGASLNVLISVIFCIILTWVGLTLARQL